jgi:hypothetical protein
MKKRKRLITISVMGAFLIFVAFEFRSCLLSVVDPKPGKGGTVSVPDGQITLSLYFGSMQHALIEPYNGVYRMLEVSRSGAPAAYYDLPSLGTTDRCRLEFYWYPTNDLIRLQDTEIEGHVRECLLDLDRHVLFGVIRRNGATLVAKLSTALSELSVPAYGGRIDESFTTVSDSGRERSVTFWLGKEQFEFTHAGWTGSTGVLIGIIEPKH